MPTIKTLQKKKQLSLIRWNTRDKEKEGTKMTEILELDRMRSLERIAYWGMRKKSKIMKLHSN